MIVMDLDGTLLNKKKYNRNAKKIFVKDFPTLDVKVMQDSFGKEKFKLCN